jgi:O-succinylbenzoate synthase
MLRRCASSGVGAWCGGMLETGIGRAALIALAAQDGWTLPGDLSATDRFFDRDLTMERFEIENGALRVPDAPGLGVTPDPAALRAFTVRTLDSRHQLS